MANESTPPTDSNLLATDKADEVKKHLKVLNQREREIIIKHFGLDGNYPRTFTDLSEEYKITKEMIRQIKNKAIRKIQYAAKYAVNLET
jgi:RNA polymerase primary sigma factor